LSKQGWLHLVTLTDDELRLMSELAEQLHRGEAACLCMARRRGWGLLSDDRAARRRAEKWHISVSGTIGVLVAAIRADQLTQADANTLLQAMIATANYRAPLTDLSLLV
jgi:predicted nucleic acid-binding protein